jgi:drug/metabolite transporter (DMT)-like permease
MRVLAPVLGPLVTADLRVLIGGLALLGMFFWTGDQLRWRQHWNHYVVIGIVNSAIPFSLFAYAALHVPAAYSVVLNSTAPLWGALFSMIWLKDRLSLQRCLGIATGAVGVALVARIGNTHFDESFLLSILACLGATACYALAAIYIKKKASAVPAMGVACASQLTAAVFLLPLSLQSPLRGSIDTTIVLNLLGLALICSATAYVLYFRLVSEVGPSRALTVTFLMPVFGMIWGRMFLSEAITWPMILGAALILVAVKWSR